MKSIIPDPWNIEAGSFPAEGSVTEQWKFLLQYAILAPSNYNTQPWLFHARYTILDLYADHRQSCPVVDPQDRELIMSCGCALFHLRCAMRHFRCYGGVDLLPGSEPDLLARVHLGVQGDTGPEDLLLFEAITRRRTNRQPFAMEAVPESLLELLQASVNGEGAWLAVAEDEEARVALARLVGEGDRLQWNQPEFRKELARWLRLNESPTLDGIPGYAVGSDDLLSSAEPPMVRTFNMGAGEAARDQEIALGSPVLAVVGTDGDQPRDWLQAGQALARLLLHARAANVWASFLNQPVEVPKLRPRVAAVVGKKGYPQCLLRLGYADSVKPTPRRSVEMVMM